MLQDLWTKPSKILVLAFWLTDISAKKQTSSFYNANMSTILAGWPEFIPNYLRKQHVPGVNNLARKSKSNNHTFSGIRLNTANTLAQLTRSTNSTLRDRNFENCKSGWLSTDMSSVCCKATCLLWCQPYSLVTGITDAFLLFTTFNDTIRNKRIYKVGQK